MTSTQILIIILVIITIITVCKYNLEQFNTINDYVVTKDILTNLNIINLPSNLDIKRQLFLTFTPTEYNKLITEYKQNKIIVEKFTNTESETMFNKILNTEKAIPIKNEHNEIIFIRNTFDGNETYYREFDEKQNEYIYKRKTKKFSDPTNIIEETVLLKDLLLPNISNLIYKDNLIKLKLKTQTKQNNNTGFNIYIIQLEDESFNDNIDNVSLKINRLINDTLRSVIKQIKIITTDYQIRAYTNETEKKETKYKKIVIYCSEKEMYIIKENKMYALKIELLKNNEKIFLNDITFGKYNTIGLEQSNLFIRIGKFTPNNKQDDIDLLYYIQNLFIGRDYNDYITTSSTKYNNNMYLIINVEGLDYEIIMLFIDLIAMLPHVYHISLFLN